MRRCSTTPSDRDEGSDRQGFGVGYVDLSLVRLIRPGPCVGSVLYSRRLPEEPEHYASALEKANVRDSRNGSMGSDVVNFVNCDQVVAVSRRLSQQLIGPGLQA